MKLPEAYLNRIKEEFGPEYDAYLQSLEEPRSYGLRVNTLKIDVASFLARTEFALTPVPWCPNGFYYDGAEKPGKHPDYFAGLYYLQEPSAMLPAAILPVEKGDYVLDLCAAPGGKSTELASKLDGTGVLFSNDISASRQKALIKNLELFGTENAVVLSEDPVRLAEKFLETFDKILIDAPCSGEGMFRKEPAVVKSWVEHGTGFYEDIQKRILKAAVRMLKPGGMLLYSTCTFNPGEDEGAVLYALSLDPDLELVEVPGLPPEVDHGRTFYNGNEFPELRKTVRIYPHHAKGEGHFAALFQKKGERAVHAVKTPVLLQNLPGFQSLSSKTREFLSGYRKTVYGGKWKARGERIFLETEADLDFTGLRILRNGLFAGEERNGRFEPSEAFAMCLKAEEAPAVYDLEPGSPDIEKYLRGETLLTGRPLPDGYVLLASGGFPLGFVKAKGGVLKNKYLPGWRLQ